MKVLCLVCSGRGHLDMGGNGFTSYLKELSIRNEVHVLSTKIQCELLANFSYQSHVFEYINQLMLPVEQHEIHQFQENFFLFLKMLELKIKSINPDLVYVDRVLGLIDPLLQSLSIRYISVGTNGAAWRKFGYSLEPIKSLQNKNGLTTKLTRFLQWSKTPLSAWSVSPYLNICFVDDRFYPTTQQRVHYINRYTEIKETYREKSKLGISLGNGTYQAEEFFDKLNAVLSIVPNNIEIVIFGGDRDVKVLLNEIITTNPIVVLGYVNFHDYFENLTHLIFAGGISTIWTCIQHEVIPIILSGNTHDQDFNAKTINRELDLMISDIFVEKEKYQKKLKMIKNNSNFSHTLEESVSIVESEFKRVD